MTMEVTGDAVSGVMSAWSKYRRVLQVLTWSRNSLILETVHRMVVIGS